MFKHKTRLETFKCPRKCQQFPVNKKKYTEIARLKKKNQSTNLKLLSAYFLPNSLIFCFSLA